MKLPNFLRINKGDYPVESRNIIDKLAGSLNIAIESLYNLANNRITKRDNLACVVKDVFVTVDALGIPTSPTAIALGTIVQKVDSADVGFAQNQTSPNVFPIATPFITWTQNGQTFEINHIAGLPANNEFLLRVTVWGA